jgi:hypothetical protein
MKKEIGLAFALVVMLFSPALFAQQPATMSVPPLASFPDLLSGLSSTPGCLGVETARTASGKQVVFAWFADRKAALAWYYSDAHVRAMKMIGAGPSPHPMADVPDDGQPVLAVASVTLASNPSDHSTPMTVSQIAIELYRPLPGGVAVGGRFAPSALTVPGLRDVPMPAGHASK